MSEESDDIKRYREGTMSGPERHALEKKALTDPFLADAIEGIETISEKDVSADVADLREKISSSASSSFIPWRIAAGIVVVVGAGFAAYFFNFNKPEQLAEQREKISTSDSIKVPLKTDSSESMLALARDSKVKDVEKPRAATQPNPATPSVVDSKPKATGAAGPTEAVSKSDIAATEPVKAEADKVEPTASKLTEQKTETSQIIPDPASTPADARKKEVVAEHATPAKSSQIQKTVVGTVTTEEEGAPLPGVNVLINGTSTGTVTDMNGNYKLTLPSGGVTLSYSFIGMETKEINPGDSPTLNVKLKPDARQLSEVVVTGQGFQAEDRDDLHKPVIQLAAPFGGIRAYNKYLENSLQYPPEALARKIKGKVTITFTVTTTGSLTDFNVVRGLGYGCEEEVVRLVKEGPVWSPSLEDDIPVESEVRVKLKFDPQKVNK